MGLLCPARPGRPPGDSRSCTSRKVFRLPVLTVKCLIFWIDDRFDSIILPGITSMHRKLEREVTKKCQLSVVRVSCICNGRLTTDN